MVDGAVESPLSGRSQRLSTFRTLTSLTAEYYPQRGDSHRELARPETSFLEFFKQSLIYAGTYCTDPECCTFFDGGRHSNRSTGQGPVGTDRAVQEGVSQSTELNYPLALFERLQDLSGLAVSHELASVFQSRFVASAPFLSKVSCLSPSEKNVPLYLLLSEALLGAAASEDAQFQLSTESLWRACVYLVTGTVEVDNSLGRAIPWLTAVCSPIRLRPSRDFPPD